MATKAEITDLPSTPVNWDAHQQTLARIAEKQAKNRAESIRCLNPDYASRKYLKRYPLYEWKVEAELSAKNAKGIWETKTITGIVTATDETTAWAMFCDNQSISIGPGDCTRTITKVGKPANSSD